jgi:NADPH:quinone reductase-like Zn-dependent oxidoreductase
MQYGPLIATMARPLRCNSDPHWFVSSTHSDLARKISIVNDSAAPATMTAVQIDEWGGPEKLVVREVPRPVPGPGQVLVRIQAASVNAIDRRIREGLLKDQVPLPFSAGSDFAGIVLEAGEGADLEPGTPVFGGLSPFTGAYAEYVAYDCELLAVKPDFLSFEQAAASAMATVPAMTTIFEDADVQPGQRVFIQGAAGGVGHLAVQLAKQRGAYVIGSASPEAKDFVLALGADEVVDYTQPGFECLLKDLDVVIDGHSAESLAAIYPAIRAGGLAITLFDQLVDPPAGIRAVEAGTPEVMKRPLREVLEDIAKLCENGLTAAVTATYPLDQVATAQETSKRGKTVLIP